MAREMITSPMMIGCSGKMMGKGRDCGPNSSSTRPRIKISRPIVTMTIENTDSPTRREKKMRSISSPNTADAKKASGMPIHSGRPS